MALTGVIHLLTETELKDEINNNFEKIDLRYSEFDISYYLVDFMEVLQSYSGFEKQEFRKILEGKNKFNASDGFVGYSFSHEVVETINSLIDKISVDTFDGYLQKGLVENHNFCNLNNNKILLEYYIKIKTAYEKAQIEGKALVFRIG